MKLHLVGGFLGSGKTTAIIHAAKLLMGQDRRVGVITNDQGKYLVDTAFYRLSEIPAVEVTGGCFCGHYDDLKERLDQLVSSTQPEVIFAESVGSCADMIATVVKPLLVLGNFESKLASFSVFTDARLLRYRLLGHDLPYSDDVVYIFDKQIEEASLVVINKMDLLPAPAIHELKQLFSSAYPEKRFIVQSSLSEVGVRSWLNLIETGNLLIPDRSLDIDHARHASGEASLAWLDEAVELDLPEIGGQLLLCGFITTMHDQLVQRGAAIGHLKVFVSHTAGGVKISFPGLDEPEWEEQVPVVQGKVRLLINARVEMPIDELRELVRLSLIESGLNFKTLHQDGFNPLPPQPIHRMA